MPRESLDSFLSQLALWTGQIIESGRTPFRKVEVNPPLVHSPCPDLPHLVLWINRDSHMAGGLILLPEKAIDQAIPSGLALAAALGLKNFACWDRKQLSIWGVTNNQARQEQEIVLPAAATASQFRSHLRDLLERLKILAVSNAPGKGEMTSYYLANLLRLALLEVVPEINEDLRTQRPKDSSEQTWQGGRDQGISKGLMTICRLLAVGHADLLPATVVANGLERALRFACSQLPAELANELAFPPEEPGLSPATSARLHHVWRRLQQLGCLHRNSLLASSAELLQTDVEGLTAFSPQTAALTEGGALLVNPGGIPGGQPPTAEIGLPAVLAWRSLVRWLRRQEQPACKATELDQLAAEFHPTLIQAALEACPAPLRQQRSQFSTALRLAWPSRRFALSAGTPRWHYDLLQLLGRAANEARLELMLPSSWLASDNGKLLWELICSDFGLLSIRLKKAGNMIINLQKSSQTSPNSSIEGREGPRDIPWDLLRLKPLSYLQILLTWPESLQLLIEQGLLQLREEMPCPESLRQEEQLFWQSKWGRQLAAWSGIDADRLRKADFRSDTAGLPCVPHPDRLRRLSNLAPDQNRECDRLDQDVALWIGPELVDGSWPEAPVAKEDVESSGRPSLARLLEEIETQVLTDGLPQFPTHYLYEHFRPQLRPFDLKGPLRESGRFFGQISLQDPNKNVVQVDSEPLAACLLLASAIHSGPVELPADAQIAADILHRYLADLHRLRHDLERESHRLLENPAAARRLSIRAWKRWQLPEPDCMDQAEALFPRAKEVK